jgi:hypothetical protein
VVDAIDLDKKIVKEYYGCYWHGCTKCFPKSTDKFNKTMERENIIKMNGYKVESIWGCEWKK